jgi:membrane fusion protein, multidrug efflux system
MAALITLITPFPKRRVFKLIRVATRFFNGFRRMAIGVQARSERRESVCTTMSDSPEKEVMHPPAPKFPSGGRLFLVGILGCALSLVAIVVWKVTQPAANKDSRYGKHGYHPMPVPVTIQTVGTTNFPIYLDGLGTVQAYNSVLVNARVPGLISEILFKEGQEVKEGDLLARIDPRSYKAQYDHALSKTAQDTAQLESAKLVLARNEELLKKNVLDRQSYDTQRFLVAQLEGTVQADRANEEIQKSQLDWTSVTAPISGRTGTRQVDVGNQVGGAGSMAGGATSIVTINQIRPIYVAFTLPQQNLGRIHEAIAASTNLEVLALDGNNKTRLGQGTLSMIDNQIDPSTATFKMKAVFRNDGEKLWPGQFVNVRLLLGTREKAVVVPAEAVQIGPQGSYVYLMTPENTAKMQSVKTGPTEGGVTLIESGIETGLPIVTDGQYRLQPGTKVSAGTVNQPGSAAPRPNP